VEGADLKDGIILAMVIDNGRVKDMERRPDTGVTDGEAGLDPNRWAIPSPKETIWRRRTVECHEMRSADLCR
jgi:hypothetical protein